MKNKKIVCFTPRKSVAASSPSIFHSHHIRPNGSEGLKSKGKFWDSTRRGLETRVLWSWQQGGSGFVIHSLLHCQRRGKNWRCAKRNVINFVNMGKSIGLVTSKLDWKYHKTRVMSRQKRESWLFFKVKRTEHTGGVWTMECENPMAAVLGLSQRKLMMGTL